MKVVTKTVKKRSLTQKVFKTTRSLIRSFRNVTNLRSPKIESPQLKKIKVAFIHNEKKILTGAHQINQIMASALMNRGVTVKSFYPKWQLLDAPIHMRGFANILFFHSLLEHKRDVLKYNLIQGTTYTTLPFLSFNIPLISHFGSTTSGFISNTPRMSKMNRAEKKVWTKMLKSKVIKSYNIKTRRPLRDVADMEKLVAKRVSRCIATSNIVRNELVAMGVDSERVSVIHNAIEDYWFEEKTNIFESLPHIVFLGRIGGDVFTLKLKGLDRLVRLYGAFPDTPKVSICMTTNKKLKDWLKKIFPLHQTYINLRKDLIPGVLSKMYGSILFIPSRYEGFCLSLVEGMSQGLVPITYAVGVAPEIIENGVNGFIVSSNDEAEKIIHDLLSNPMKRLKMAQAAKTTSRQFNSKAIADKLMDLYQQVRKESCRQN